jgi:hypothetical protein
VNVIGGQSYGPPRPRPNPAPISYGVSISRGMRPVREGLSLLFLLYA